MQVFVLLCMAGCWLLGALLAASVAGLSHAGAAVAALMGAGLLVAGGAELRSWLWGVPLSGLAFLAGLGLHAPAMRTATQRGLATVHVQVERLRTRLDQVDVEARILAAEFVGDAETQALPVGAWLWVSAPIERAPPPGSRWRALVRLQPITDTHNLSPHPPWPSVKRAAWRARLVEAAPSTVTRAGRLAWLHRARVGVRAHLRDTLAPREASLARALVLGEAAAVDQLDRELIAAAGLAHLLAVSGLHVAIVAGVLFALLRGVLRRWAARVVEPAQVAAAVAAPLVLLYATFAGGAPSAWRAGVTAALTWLAVACGRRPRATAVGGLAVLLLSIGEPQMVIRPAFLLSVLATAAILSAVGDRGSSFRVAARISWRTLLATTPLVWWCFGRVPWIAWASNIALLPMASMSLIPLANLHAAAALAPSVQHLTARAFELAAAGLYASAAALSHGTPSTPLPPLGVAQGILVTAVCVALLWRSRWRTKVGVLVVASLLFMVAEWSIRSREQPRDVLRVTFVDVGQGDAAIVDLPDGRLMVIDSGPPTFRASPVQQLLEARRRTRIDVLVITHSHPDHLGAARQLLQNFQVGELWASPPGPGELSAAKLFATATKRLTRLVTPSELCRSPRHFGAAAVEVLWPCPHPDAALGPNENSLTLRVGFHAHRFLFTGDIERVAEQALATRQDLRADVLKVPHHGSRTSSSAAFLRAVDPDIAVISSGRANRFGHPHPDVLARLQESQALVLRTDQDGGIILTSDGRALSRQSWREPSPALSRGASFDRVGAPIARSSL